MGSTESSPGRSSSVQMLEGSAVSVHGQAESILLFHCLFALNGTVFLSDRKRFLLSQV